MKCEICGKKVKTTFLNKIIGTYLYDENGKKHLVCNECQKKYNKEQMLEIIKNK